MKKIIIILAFLCVIPFVVHGQGYVGSIGGSGGAAATSETDPVVAAINGIVKSNGTTISACTDSDITGKLLTGYSSGAGTVAATDSILTAINKLNGNDANKVPVVANVKTYMGAYEQAISETSEAATCNWANGSSCVITMEANTTAWTLTMSNPVAGQRYMIWLKQPDSGGHNPLPTFSPTVVWAGGTTPTLTATANKRDVISCYYSTALSGYFCDIDWNF